ncbi:hypothetical protein EON65_35065, partial [archaeon]
MDSIRGLTITEEFYTTITSDSITYTSLYIPPGVSTITLQLSASAVSFQPRLLIRSNALPTTREYDGEFNIVHAPGATYLVDKDVGPLTLYLAFRGDDLLYSKRYFAGSPEYCTISLVSVLEYTSNVPSPGRFDHTPYTLEIPPYTKSHTTSNTQESAIVPYTTSCTPLLLVSMHIPPLTYSWSTTITFNMTHTPAHIPSHVSVYVYFGSIHQHDGGVYVTFPVHTNHTHTHTGDDNNMASIPIQLSYPTPGEWYIRIAIGDGDGNDDRVASTRNYNNYWSVYETHTHTLTRKQSIVTDASETLTMSTNTTTSSSRMSVSFAPIHTVSCPLGYLPN